MTTYRDDNAERIENEQRISDYHSEHCCYCTPDEIAADKRDREIRAQYEDYMRFTWGDFWTPYNCNQPMEMNDSNRYNIGILRALAQSDRERRAFYKIETSPLKRCQWLWQCLVDKKPKEQK